MLDTSHNSLLSVAVVALACLGIASVVTGHDQLEVSVGAIVALAGGAPTMIAFMQQRSSDRAATVTAANLVKYNATLTASDLLKTAAVTAADKIE